MISSIKRSDALLFFLFVFTFDQISKVELLKFNSNGYLLYCPCMGRFGNQIEHFLGALSFAKTVNRTLILPPFVEYPKNAIEAKMVEFEEYFQVKPLTRFHQVITAADFFKHLAKVYWPEDKRQVLCWAPRRGLGCWATQGNPFGPFWQYLNVTFNAGDLFFGEIVKQMANFDDSATVKKFINNFPAHTFPVLAFASAPASFPVLKGHRFIQFFLHWSPKVLKASRQFRAAFLKRPFVAIHLRTDIDWNAVCDLIDEVGQRLPIFASPQCTGYSGEHGVLTKQMCQPSVETILRNVEEKVRELKANSVFVSSDKLFYIAELQARLSTVNNTIKVVRLKENNVHKSLALMAMSDHFIANCVSTFSAFVVRQREFNWATPKSTSFFGFFDDKLQAVDEL